MNKDRHFAYVIYSKRSNKHYYGYSTHVERRLDSHNHPDSGDWTRNHQPWVLIFSKEFTTKTDALKFEKWLKSIYKNPL